MKAILNIKKPEGLTPYQVVTKFKRKHPSYKDVKIAYAGRLDPMAKGVLLLLIEPETKKREEYQKLPKEYEFEILFGVSTDTHDLLGMPTAGSRKLTKDVLEKELKNITTNYKGTIVQKYPVYSSIRIKGKPLYWWARNNMLNKIQIPKKKIQIYNIKFESLKSKDKEKLLSSVIKKINKVEGDFRQKEIIKSWKKKYYQGVRQTNFTSRSSTSIAPAEHMFAP